MIGWLIKQQQLWSECKGESKCGTLFFTAGSELWIRIRIAKGFRRVLRGYAISPFRQLFHLISHGE